MINIVLFCEYGASTGMLAENIKEAAREKNIDVIVNAYSFMEIESVIDKTDIALLGPQVRFRQKKLEKQYANKDVIFHCVDPQTYGSMNGAKVLEDILELLGGNDE